MPAPPGKPHSVSAGRRKEGAEAAQKRALEHRAALSTRDAVYYERTSLAGGGELELRTYFHRTRRNLIVAEVELDCTACANRSVPQRHLAALSPPFSARFAPRFRRSFGAVRLPSAKTERTGEKWRKMGEIWGRNGRETAVAEWRWGQRVSLRSFSGHPSLSDVVFQQRGGGADGPRELMGVLRAPENCEPSNRHLYDTNHTLGYVHDVCPTELSAAAGGKATAQLLSVLTLSSEESDKADKAAAKDAVVARARKLYRDAKAMAPTRLLAEHTAGWAALWEGGECHDPHTVVAEARAAPRPCHDGLRSDRAGRGHRAGHGGPGAAADHKLHAGEHHNLQKILFCAHR